MNKAFRLIWNTIKEAWIVVAEKVASKGGIPVTVSLSAAALMLAAGTAAALPTGAQVVYGTAGITTVGSTMTITNSPNTIINWQGFSIAANEATRFIQQSSASAVLNRVVGGNASQIYGTLQSNGKVFLINQNGILFGAGSTINVNGLVASTLNLTNEDFLAGRMKFSGELTAGKVINEGTITTPAGGSVYLIAPNVENSGIITAPNGDILLAAGKEVLLVEKDNPEIATVVTAPEGQALNLGTLATDAGRIGVYGSIVRQKGIISANSAVQDANGRIILKATKEATVAAGSTTTANGPTGGSITVQATEGTTLVSGTIEAKGASGKGGTVQLLGQQVGLIEQAKIDVSGATGGGTVLVGGDYQGKNAAIQNAQATYMGAGTIIKADATDTGNGGKVILWSDNITRAYGSISARGGASGGDGGFVEVSGKGYLDFLAHVNTTASYGKTGMLLLDPADITISNATDSDITTSSPFQDFSNDGGTSNLSVATLQAALANSFVTVSTSTATGSAPNSGTITVNSDVTWNSIYGLTLNADHDIVINANIAAIGSSAIGLTAGNTVSVASGKTVSTTSSSVSITGTAGVDINGTVKGDYVSLSSPAYIRGAGVVEASSIMFQSGGQAGAIGTLATPFKTRSLGGTGTTTISAGYMAMTNPSALYLDHTGDLSLTGMGINVGTNAPIKITSSGALTTSNLNSGTSDLFLQAGGLLTLNPNATITGGNVTFVADKMAFDPSSSISASGGTVWLKPRTSGTLIDLGSASDAATGTLELSPGELNAISADLLRIGDSSSGNISITDFLELAVPTLSLRTGGTLSQSGSGSIVVESLAIKAAQSVDLSGGYSNVTNLAVDVTDSTHQNNTILFSNSGSLNLGANIDGVAGLTTTINGTYNEASQDGFAYLYSGGFITQNSGALINMKAVGLNAYNGITLTEANGTGVIAGSASMGSFSYTSSNSIKVAAINGTNGVSASAGTVTLASAGSVSQSQQVSAGTLNIAAATGITLTNATATTVQLTNSTSGDINFTGNGNISVEATNSASTGAISLQAATGDMTLVSASASDNIYARVLAGTMSINGAVNSINGLFLAEAQNISQGMVSTISAKSVQLNAVGTLSLMGTINAFESIELKTDNLTTDPGYTRLNVDSSSIQHEITIKTHTAGRQISIGSGAGLVISDTSETIFNSPTLVIGDEGTDASGALQVNSAITRTGRLALISGSDITQSAGATISTDELGLITSGSGNITLNENNAINKMVAKTDAGTIALKSSNALTLVDVVGGIQNPEIYSGIVTNSGNVTLTTTGGNLTLNKAISAGTGAVSLTASGAIIDNTGTTGVTAASFSASAGGDIGSLATPFMTKVSQWGAVTSTSGSIYLENYGAVSSGSSAISAASGDIVLKAHSPLTIGTGGVSAGGNITLVAAATGGADNLTLNGLVSAGGNLTLQAGNSILENIIPVAVGGITRTANLNNASSLPASLDTTTPPEPLYEQTTTGTLEGLQLIQAVSEDSDTSHEDDERKNKHRNTDSQNNEGNDNDQPKKNFCN